MESYSTIIFDEYTTARVGLLDENSPVKEGVMTFDRETDEAAMGISVVFTSRKQVNNLIGQLIKLKKQMKDEIKDEKKPILERVLEAIKNDNLDEELAKEFYRSSPSREDIKKVTSALTQDIFNAVAKVVFK